MLKFFQLLITTFLTLLSWTCYASNTIPPNYYSDPVKDFNYVKKVAHESGSPGDEYKLGKYYEEGYVTKLKLIQAYVWYRLASLDKFQPAEVSLARVTKKLSPTELSQAEKLYQQTRDQVAMEVLNEVRNFNTQK